MVKDDALDGLAQLVAMRDGAGGAPIAHTLGFHLVDLERGWVVFEGNPGRSVYNPIGTVHGGYAATSLDSVRRCTVHSSLSTGQGYTTLELKVSYHRALNETSGRGARGRRTHFYWTSDWGFRRSYSRRKRKTLRFCDIHIAYFANREQKSGIGLSRDLQIGLAYGQRMGPAIRCSTVPAGAQVQLDVPGPASAVRS